MEYSMIYLSSAGQGEFDSILSTTGLNLCLNSYVTLQASIVDKSPRVAFSRALSNIKEIYIQLYRPPIAPTNNAATSIWLQQWVEAFTAEVNYSFGGNEELLITTSPTYRGALDANGRPTASAIANQAAAVASDKTLSDKPTSFQIEIGAKK